MKKFIILLLMILVVVSTTSCQDIDNTNSYITYDPHSLDTKNYHIEIDNTKEMLKTIITCFDNKDKESLKELFATSISNEYDLDYHIDNAFSIYEGKSLSYKIDSGDQKSKTIIDGQYVYLRYDGELYDIKMDNGECFKIFIVRCVVDDENPNNIGLNRISLCQSDGTKLASIGELINQDLLI